jgi:hypothetical protein
VLDLNAANGTVVPSNTHHVRVKAGGGGGA